MRSRSAASTKRNSLCSRPYPNEAFSWRARRARVLAATLRRRAAQVNVRFLERVQQGDPAETILLHASSLGADVIVAGTHQRRGFERFKAGSVAERIAAKATVPVLLVPQGTQADASWPFSHPVAAVDLHEGSEPSRRSGDRAGRPPGSSHHRSRGPGCRLRCATTLAPVRRAADNQGQLLRDARRRLPLVVPADHQTPAAIHTRVLVGDVTTEITGLVGSVGGDLLIVGVPARGPLSRTLFGATASRLLRVSRVPVLVVPDRAPAGVRPAPASLPLAA